MRRIKVSHKNTKRIKKKAEARNTERKSIKIQKNGFVVHKRKGKKYISGIFWSKKNDKELIFRSTYEFAYFYILENDSAVISYAVEPFSVPYKHPFDNRIHKYWPDILILHRDGSLVVIEIKPKGKVGDPVVQRKAMAAKAHIRRNKLGAVYRFITEEDIFDTPADYLNLKKKLLRKEYVL